MTFKFSISKEFSFSASHCLDHLPKGHPCRNVHGHNYKVKVILSQVDAIGSDGMLLDYKKMKPFKEFLDEELDHKHLNDILVFHPTAELIAKYLFHTATRLFGVDQVEAVQVSETDKTMAEFRVIK